MRNDYPFPFAGIDKYRTLVLIGAGRDDRSGAANDLAQRRLLYTLHVMQAEGPACAVWKACRCDEKSASHAYAVLLESQGDVDTLARVARTHGQDSITVVRRDGATHSSPLLGQIRYIGRTTVNDEILGTPQWNNVSDHDILPRLYYVFAGVPGFLSFDKRTTKV